MSQSTSAPPPALRFPALTRRQRNGLVALLLLLVGFGCLVDFRAAFLKRRMTDVQVYFRAAWAVRAGEDIYSVTDENHWHYHYPPLLAILLMPLAQAPKDAAPLTAALPFSVAVGIWYVFSLGCLAFASHVLASAIEATARERALRTPPWGCRRWWALRLLPILICLPSIGGTLMRGQVNLFLLAVLCAMIATALRGQSWRAGFWLAGAICLKVIPAFLILYPLWRRDTRWLAGCAAGLIVGMGLLPAVFMGPGRTLACYREWTRVLVMPALGKGEDRSRAKELIDATSTDSQAFLLMVHNTRYLDRIHRPAQADDTSRLAHWLIGGALTALTLLTIGWRRRNDSYRLLLSLGALTLLMPLLSPVCHLHYFCLILPLVMSLIHLDWEKQRERLAPLQAGQPVRAVSTRVGLGLSIAVLVNLVCNTLPHIPGMELTRDIGLASYGCLLLWLVAVVALALGLRQRNEMPAVPQVRGAYRSAA